MATIVRDSGFQLENNQKHWSSIADLGSGTHAIELGPEADPDELAPRLTGVQIVRIVLPAFSDGRGFSLAKGLRRAGYTGTLRAAGHVLADQYAMARRCGFDEVEIDDAMAARQPEDQWRARANWQSHDYRAALTQAQPG